MNQLILHEKKPRDALKASRGLKAVDAAIQDSQINNTARTVTVKGDILPMVVLFEMPTGCGVSEVVQRLAGTAPIETSPVISGQTWSGWYSCRKF